jgi:hypothetical protein
MRQEIDVNSSLSHQKSNAIASSGKRSHSPERDRLQNPDF